MSTRKEQPEHLRLAAEARTNPVAIATRLKELRAAKEMSQAGLAKLAGISQQAIAAMETARVDTPRHLDVVSKALGVSAEYLRTGRNHGVPLMQASDLRERSSYPRPDSEYHLTQPMAVPHEDDYGPATFAIRVPDAAVSAAISGALIFVDPDVEPVPGDMILVHYKNGPTVRIYRDTGDEPEYMADNPAYATLRANQVAMIGTVVELRILRSMH